MLIRGYLDGIKGRGDGLADGHRPTFPIAPPPFDRAMGTFDSGRFRPKHTIATLCSHPDGSAAAAMLGR
jgi:hypothetical protein